MKTLLLTTLALLGSAAPARPQEEPPRLPALAFRWPESGAVPVRETQVKNDVETVKRYVLRWRPESADGPLVLEFTDYELVSYAGHAASDPEVAAALAFVEPLLRAMPRWRIGRDGSFRGHFDFVAGVEKMIADGKRDETFGPEAEALLRKTLLDPAAAQRLEQQSAATWKLFAEAWIGLELAVGESRSLATETPIGTDRVKGRTDLRCVERFEHAGVDCVRLQSVTVLSGPDLVRALERLLAPHLARDPAAPERKTLASARKELMLDGVYEVATLAPHEVVSVTLDAFEVVGQMQQRQQEKRSYVFDWRAAPAAPAAPAADPAPPAPK